ncbi:MAG: hypothetical protein ACREWG_07380, partial [Gammaproteobacteria bacterium]
VGIKVELQGVLEAKAQFEDLQRQLQELTDRRAAAESRITAEASVGLFGEFEQRGRLVEIYRETALAIEALLPQMRALAAANPGIVGLADSVDAAEAELAGLRQTSNEAILDLRQGLQSGAASLFKEFITGAKTAGEAFAAFGNIVLETIAEIIAKEFAKQLFGGLADSAGGGGGFLDVLFAFFHSGGIVGAGGPRRPVSPLVFAGATLFHGGGVVGAGGPRRPISPLVFAGAPSFQTGGLVGLRDNEVPAILERGEEVLTRDDPRHRANAGGVTVVMNINTPDAQSFRRSQGQIAAELSIGIGRARRNLP